MSVAESINQGGANARNFLTAYPQYLKSGVDWGIKGSFLVVGIIGAVMLIRFLVVSAAKD